MASPRTPRIVAFVFVAVFLGAPLSLVVDPGAAQVPTYCPQGDDGPAPPAAGDPKEVLDLMIGDTTMVLVPSGGGAEVPGDERGIYTVLPFAGTLNVTVSVDENGGGTSEPEQTVLRAILGRPDGSTVVRTANIAVPESNGNTTHTFQFTVGLGRHTITFHVNPDQLPAEECVDGVPNSACPSGGAQGCEQTYYHNNRQTVGVLAGNLPDLALQAVAQSGPTRATAEAHEDSEATFSLTITNLGDSTAFNLSSLNPGANPMTLRVAVRDCDCPSQVLDVIQIPVGGTRTVTTETFPLHGLTDDVLLDVWLDHDDWVAEVDEVNNEVNRTLPLPTPDLVAGANADLPREGDAYVTPRGRDVTFSVSVTNEGIGQASTATGGTFDITVHKDGDTDDPILERNLTLEALGSAAFTVTIPADDVTGTHTFTVRTDPDDVVFESSDSNNEAQLRLVVAVYDATVTVDDTERRTTVPPGVTGKIPFTIKNTGTVTDTFDFSAPAGERTRQRYLDGDGNTITQTTLAPGASFTGEVAYDIRPTDEKDTEFDTRIIAASRIVHTQYTANVTFVVGPDTVAPDISLERPSTGFLTGNQIVVRIRDNVAVTSAETDLLAGQFTSIQPSTEGGILYVLNATGQPQQFSFRVRATDAAGNTATEQLSIVRDQTAPRITNTRFTPGQGARPGDTVSLAVTAQDQNMDRVEVSIWQRRPGPDYKVNHTLQFGGGVWILRDWVLPERPGYFHFNVTAYDRAGNSVTTQTTYTVNGLNLRVVTARPTLSNPEPEEGERLTFSYVIENTSPRFSTGNFFVQFVLDRQRAIGLQTLNLGPGERTQVSFSWIATPGPHDWAIVVDQANQVFEDDEEVADNVLQVTSANLFPDYPLFVEPDEASATSAFGARVQEFWYVPLLMVTVGVLFTIAFVLGRRPMV